VSDAEFPKEVQAFVERHLTSGAQLEVLLLLHADAARTWTPAAVGRELRIDPDQAEVALARLAADKLLRREEGGYCFAPVGAKKGALVDALARLYPAYRLRIVSFIFSKPARPMRDFSDAFRLREDAD
jgi:hypothetical protein